MTEDSFYLIKKKALPEVLQKVVEVKRMLESDRTMTVQEATEQMELSRSSFYKYKDDIFPFHENTRGRTLTFMLQLDDQPGILSEILGVLARGKTNILTIHQAIPTGGIASLTLSVEILPESADMEVLMHRIETTKGVHDLKILGIE